MKLKFRILILLAFIAGIMLLFLFGCGEEPSEVSIEVNIPAEQPNVARISTLTLIVRDAKNAKKVYAQEELKIVAEKAMGVVTVDRYKGFSFVVEAKDANGAVIGRGIKTVDIREDTAFVDITLNFLESSVTLNVSLPQSPLVEISSVNLTAIDEIPVSEELQIDGSIARVTLKSLPGTRRFTIEALSPEGIAVASKIAPLFVPESKPASFQVTLEIIKENVTLDVQLPVDLTLIELSLTITAIDGFPFSKNLNIRGSKASVTVAVPVGRQRTFLIEAKDSEGDLVALGSTTLDVLRDKPAFGRVEMRFVKAITDETKISKVINERWRKGYVTQDIELYMSAFWEDGFLYHSDNGTTDPADDVIFNDIRQEKDSTIRIFERFQTIELEVTEPPQIRYLNVERTKAEVRNHYKIALTVADGRVLEGGHTGYFAEGDNIFTFEKRNGEWRITVWKDEAFIKDEIEKINGAPPQLIITWGAVKSMF